jgi:hypothetical protein
LEPDFTQERTELTGIESMKYMLSTVVLTAEGVICGQVKDQGAAGLKNPMHFTKGVSHFSSLQAIGDVQRHNNVEQVVSEWDLRNRSLNQRVKAADSREPESFAGKVQAHGIQPRCVA